MSLNPIKRLSTPQTVTDGAGVVLQRVFGHNDTGVTDPFLLLDHFRNDDPNVQMPGFPWHPHRGIETISYILEGTVHHEDSMGNSGTLGSGDVQWMTAGSGIIHQEMPVQGKSSIAHGFQLWANLPSDKKMIAPRYQDIQASEIPEIVEDDGTKARVITGEFWGRRGPVTGVATDPRYLDITVPPGVTRSIRISLEHHAFAYVFDGGGKFMGASDPFEAPTEYVTSSGVSDPVPAHPVENRTLVLFDRGDEIRVTAGETGLRFLLVSGQPLREPVAWHGPIVMNTESELITAFQEYQSGTFLRHQR